MIIFLGLFHTLLVFVYFFIVAVILSIPPFRKITSIFFYIGTFLHFNFLYGSIFNLSYEFIEEATDTNFTMRVLLMDKVFYKIGNTIYFDSLDKYRIIIYGYIRLGIRDRIFSREGYVCNFEEFKMNEEEYKSRGENGTYSEYILYTNDMNNSFRNENEVKDDQFVSDWFFIIRKIHLL